MKCYNSTESYKMHEDIKKALDKMREERNFNAKQYISEKIKLLNTYMKESCLDTCVVAVSGGIDSAVVLGLVASASVKNDSPIRNIVPLLLPCYKNNGVTNQEDATYRGLLTCSKFIQDMNIINMKEIVEKIDSTVRESLGLKTDDWAVGQLVPYARTPVLYYTTSLLNVQGYKPIIVGTTNFSEGGYLGYVGKASDGMVDVQLISDIFKSEVYKVAEELGVPKEVLNVTPAGDMYDNRVDEEVFGAPYDFVEFYQTFIQKSEEDKRSILNDFRDNAMTQYTEWKDNLEHLHRYNSHKYLCGSPAVHLDLFKSEVPNGWNNNARWFPSEEK